MIPFFRKIRKKMADDNKPMKYLRYAIGEIALVVIGILIALQINNWNENNKANKNEIYILTEISNNLNEDFLLVEEIIVKREKAKNAFNTLHNFVKNKEFNIDSLALKTIDILTFERYFPINNAYEILKSKGLKLSNNKLTTSISRYYDYEQNKASTSIKDIEVTVLNIYDNPKSLMRFFMSFNKDESVVFKNINQPEFKEELSHFLLAFEDNNGGTLNTLIAFRNYNRLLFEQIEIELNDIQ